MQGKPFGRMGGFKGVGMRLGKEAMEALQAEITGRLKAGDVLVVAGPVALKGTSLLAMEKQEELGRRFSEGFLQNAKSLYRDFGVGERPKESPAWECAAQAGANALYPMGEGGFLCALWKMAEASQVGLRADFRKVPIRQESIELCEVFDLNPYRLLSEGSLLIGIPAGEALVQELGQKGICAAVIGQANKENDRLLYSGQSARYLERPGRDELYKVLDGARQRL